MTENEKQYRDALLLGLRKEGFIHESTESEIAFKLGYEKAINYTCCSLQLKDKYNENFAYFVENKVRKQTVGSIYWYKDTGYTSLDKLFKEYQKLTKPLIV